MLFAFAYSVLRLLLDLVEVRLRLRDPEAELLRDLSGGGPIRFRRSKPHPGPFTTGQRPRGTTVGLWGAFSRSYSETANWLLA